MSTRGSFNVAVIVGTIISRVAVMLAAARSVILVANAAIIFYRKKGMKNARWLRP